MSKALLATAKLALPLMSPEQRAEAEKLIADLSDQSDRTDLQNAAAAFERDMRPLCNAVAEALQTGDVDALKGLRAFLPHALDEMNQAPALADVLAHQMGKAFLQGLKSKPEEPV